MKHTFSLVEPSHIVAQSSRRRGSMQGFSLVELSIVLVILGLLTGGILTGQSLIRAAELRAVTTEFQNYQTAVMTFRSKYFALPGDMRNAEDFWDTMATGTCPNATAGTGTQTCNGDGNGVLDNGMASQAGEQFTFWQHLANAGLIEGTYTGIAGGGGSQDAVFGTNIPVSKLSNAGWHAQSANNYAGDTAAYAYDYGNMLAFGSKRSNSSAYDPVLTPEEAWNVDKKLDDGEPAQGKIIAVFWNNLCSAADDGSHANNDLIASYRLSDSAVQCALHFAKSF